MINPEALVQMARLAGRDQFLRAVGVPSGSEPATLDAGQLEAIRELVSARMDQLVQGLLEEAMASDDVSNPESALAYLDDRLSFLGPLLSESQRLDLRSRCEQRFADWR